ncbi:CRISPR-associated protein Cas5 [Variovorax sp. RO1]|uniref:CRISPR-associated protein Cas5 n=1 Tax=Variovorax sp. RO1 TaxID=2066034 RepID=UPI001180DCC7
MVECSSHSRPTTTHSPSVDTPTKAALRGLFLCCCGRASGAHGRRRFHLRQTQDSFRLQRNIEGRMHHLGANVTSRAIPVRVVPHRDSRWP